MRAATIAALIATAVALAACGDDSSEQADCPGDPAPELTPAGSGAAAFTMGIRVNQVSDIDQIESSLKSFVLPRDVFVVNTEFQGSRPGDWDRIVDELDERFPCNRIASLNGLGRDSGKAAYAYALTDNDKVDAILVDWEPDTYEAAGKGAWTPALEENLVRIREELGLLAEKLEGTKARMGLVPDYLPPWDYGSTARVVALRNLALDPTHRGYQIVQTQPNCGTPGAAGPLIGGLVAELIRQYRPLLRLAVAAGRLERSDQPNRVFLQHLGFEIAFSTSPNPSASEAVERIGPRQAALCSKQVLAAGGAGILYWADAPSLKAMLETPAGKALRPSGSS